jgi:hypothetical protein
VGFEAYHRNGDNPADILGTQYYQRGCDKVSASIQGVEHVHTSESTI